MSANSTWLLAGIDAFTRYCTGFILDINEHTVFIKDPALLMFTLWTAARNPSDGDIVDAANNLARLSRGDIFIIVNL